MNKICVYTCITGNYDDLIEIKNRERNIDYICYTNNKSLKSKTWKIIYIDDISLSNNILNRKIKILGANELKKYDITLYMDGQIQFITSINSFINEYVDLKKYDIIGFKHSMRNSVSEEMVVCVEYGKDSKDNIINLKKFYKKENFPDDLLLSENTLLFRNFNNEKVIQTMKIWYDMVLNFSHRDQLSFQYALWKTNAHINLLNINVWNNNYFISLGHKNNLKAQLTISYGFNNIDNINNVYEFNFYFDNEFIEYNLIFKKNTNMIRIFINNISNVEIEKILFNNEKIEFQCINAIKYNELYLFYDIPVILFNCDFKKNEKLNIKIFIKLVSINKYVLFYLNNIISKNDEFNQNYKNLINEYNIVISDKKKLTDELSLKNDELLKIKNSKRWKFINKVLNIIDKIKK